MQNPGPSIQYGFNNQRVKLFVYGSLKRGFLPNDTYLSKATYIGATNIPGILLNLGRYPGLLERSHTPCRVYGEVYETTWENLLEIDDYENVSGGLFRRVQYNTNLGNVWTYKYGQVIYPSDTTICVQGGVWLGGHADRITYAKLVEYFEQLKVKGGQLGVIVAPPPSGPGNLIPSLPGRGPGLQETPAPVKPESLSVGPGFESM